jgi:hypothetical protein
MLQITPVLSGYLYSIEQVMPPELLESISKTDWANRSYNRLEIGRGRRRQLDYQVELDQAVNDYCCTELARAIELACQIRFTGQSEQSFQYWIDEPGFRPAMHTDGDLASAVQIYLQADGRLDLGTAFYHSADPQDLTHTFASRPNTGYVMLNQPEPGRPALWHDMTQAVPAGSFRLCLYLTLGRYQRV